MASFITLKLLLLFYVSINAAPISFDGCGVSKYCMYWPSDCDKNPATCERFLAFYAINGGDILNVELAAKQPSDTTPDFYAAIGYSNDNEMGNDSVTFCLTSGSTVKPAFGYNPPWSYPVGRAPTQLIGGNYEATLLTGFTGSLSDGYLKCSFGQKVSVPQDIWTGSGQRIFSLDASSYYPMLARGPYNATSNTISRHSETPIFPDAGVYLQASPQSIKLISKTGCGYAKGCLEFPVGCSPDYDCNAVLTYTVVNKTDVQFELSSRKPKAAMIDYYAAVGFSVQGTMPNASVTACTFTGSTGGYPQISSWYNPGPSHQSSVRVNFDQNETPLTKVEEVGVVNDMLVCRFTQKIAVPDEDKPLLGMLVPLDATYKLLLARGPFNASTNSLMRHTETPLISESIDVTGPFNPTTDPISVSECNKTKGCLPSPDKCDNDEDPCRKLTYAASSDGNWVSFEIAGRTTRGPQVYTEVSMYAAVAFSNDKRMPDTSFTFCSYSHTHGGDVGYGYIPNVPGVFNFPVMLNISSETKNDYLKFLSAGIVDDVMTCRFMRRVDPPPGYEDQVASLREAHYVFLLRGTYVYDYTREHSEIPIISDSPMNLTNFKDPYVTTPAPTGTPNHCDGKGCVLSDPNCTPGETCTASLTYVIDPNTPNYINFEASVKFPQNPPVPPYIAVGFSLDELMGNDAVTLCTYQSDAKGTVGLYYNPNQHTASQRVDTDVSKIINGSEITLKDNVLTCKFQQLINPPTALQDKVFPLNTKLYHILLARGHFDLQNNVPTQHDDTPFVSSAVNVSTTQTGVETDSGGNTRAAMKAHGILMILGWWVFIVNGILIARYFKSVISKEYGGIKLWFHLHRTVNSLGLLCIIAAFITIFVVTNGEWVGKDAGAVRNHAILGMTAVVSGLLNPIMALARCHPGTEMRPVFNWAHRTVGILAWCCASAAIFEATNSPFSFDLTTGGRWGQVPRSLMYAYFIILGLVVLILEELYASFEGKASAAPSQLFVKSPEPPATGSPALAKPSTKFGTLRIVALLVFNMAAICIVIIEAVVIGLSAST